MTVLYTGCPTRYRTRHFFNNSNTNDDIATKFEQEYVRCVRNEEECVCSEPPHSEKIGVWCGMTPAAHNWPHLRCNHHNSCIYGNLQHLCKSVGR